MPAADDFRLPEWHLVPEGARSRFGVRGWLTEPDGTRWRIQQLEPAICSGAQREAVANAVKLSLMDPGEWLIPWRAGLVEGQLALAEPALNALRLDELIWECQVQGLTSRGKREIYRQVMKPVLEACRTAFQRTPEPGRVSLATDHLVLVFPPGTPLPSLTVDGLPGGSWPDFEIRFRPFCLRTLLPASVDGEEKRLAWLGADPLQRFAGLIYHVFGGVSHEEGCPENASYTPTRLLGGRANYALQGVLSPDGRADPVGSMDALLEATFAAEAGPVQRLKRKPAQEANLRSGPAGTPGPDKPAAPAARKVPGRTGPRPLRWGLLVGIGAGLIMALGTVVGLARKPKVPVSPATAFAASAPSAFPAPPGIPPAPQPNTGNPLPASNPLEEAARLGGAGQKGEAVRLLLAAAATADSAGALPLLQSAAAQDSPVALIKLASLQSNTNPTAAAAQYLKAWQLIQRRTAQPPAAYAAESTAAITGLKDLADGDALLQIAREPGLSPLRPEALTLQTLAIKAFRKGVRSGPADPAKASAAVSALKSASDAQLSINRPEAIAGYLTAIEGGSRAASLAITADIFDSATAGEKSRIKAALNTSADAGNPVAMFALVNLINPETTNPSEATRRAALLAKAVQLNNPDALFLQAQSAFSDSGPFGGTSTAPSSSTEAAYNQLLKAASAGHESAFRMVKGASSQSKLTAAQQQVFASIEQKKLAGTLPKLN